MPKFFCGLIWVTEHIFLYSYRKTTYCWKEDLWRAIICLFFICWTYPANTNRVTKLQELYELNYSRPQSSLVCMLAWTIIFTSVIFIWLIWRELCKIGQEFGRTKQKGWSFSYNTAIQIGISNLLQFHCSLIDPSETILNEKAGKILFLKG